MSSATTTLRMVLLGEDKSAGRALRGVGDEADKSGKKMQAFHKAGAVAGTVLAGGLALAGAAAVQMTKRAAEDQASSEKMAQTFRHAADASDYSIGKTEEWITAQGKLTGVTDDELRPALSKLVVATHSVAKAQSLAHLAMNVSAGTGKSLEAVSTALAKAQNGNVGGLARLGVATKDASGKTLSLNQITKNLADTYQGAAAKAAETTAGKQKILTTQMGELQEQIGYKLLPVMLKLVDVGLKVVDWMSRNTKLVGVIVGVLGGLVAVTWAVSAATKAWAAITKVAAAAQWTMNAAMDANPIGLVVIAIAALVAGLVIAYKHSETFRRIVNGAFHAVAAAAEAAFGWIKAHWKLLLAIIVGPIGGAAILVISHWGKIKAGAAAVLAWIRGAWPRLRDVIVAPIRAAAGVLSGVWGNIRGGALTVVTFIASIPGRLKALGGRFGDAGHALIQAFVDGMKHASGIISGIAGNVWDAVRGLLNGAIDRINNALQFTIHVGPKSFSINPPDIPHLATGGIVTSPTRALIGEAGPEAVIPLSGANGRAALAGLGGGSVVIHVHANGLVTPQQTAALIQAELVKLKRQRGGSPLGLA